MKFSLFLVSILIILGFIACTVIAAIINPHILTSFFSNSPSKLFYDVEHYANSAIHQTCNAFYPLWPWLINRLGKPQTVDEAALYFRVFGSLFSLIGVPLFLFLLLRNIKSYKIAILVTGLYAICPLAIFRVIGYTEGIFSFLSLLLLIVLTDLKINSQVPIGTSKLIYLLISTFLLSLLLSLTRPFLIQSLFASISALGSILVINWGINRIKNGSDYWKILKIHGVSTLMICFGAIAGYCIYGYYCLGVRGDFLAPFHDQKAWGKQLGFYPQLFFIPLTYADFISIYLPFIALIVAWLIAISSNIRKLSFIIPNLWQWVFLFAYPPAFIAYYGFDFQKKNLSKVPSKLQEIGLTQSSQKIATSYTFWFCIYFALIHSIIIVFSDEKLTSLRRFIFGTPYFFVVVAYLSQCFPSRMVSKLLLWILGLSSIGLVQYWLDYSNYVWIG
ncbi:hypothetical protein Pse7429DRAFT_4711 [Pseudanabaena biceps PCC 7429]|uniref:Glycosyltransferase RgtA/B/C/D-like domain-containing protein n=1 Tax=Pseudanabaena biceps PCC 7429 TaxID=927668 RepID=L8MRX3_9CYAN|nr:hypothetical protein Pse7429DRAFT_4711 [Pseudanabaena biceps PCC 7429]